MYSNPGCDCPDCLLLTDKISTKFERVPNSVLDDYLAKVYSQELTPADLHKDMYDHVFKNNRRMAEAGYGKRFTEASDKAEFELMQKMEKNIAQFSGGKLHAYTDELRRSMYKNGVKLPFADWQTKAKSISRKHLVTWRKTEERTMAQAASSASQWSEIVRRSYLYPNLQYVTAHDEKVRDSHRVLDGAIYPVSDPFWNTHYPPNGWNCRCIVIQTDRKTKEAKGTIKISKGMSNNAGQSGLLVTNDHPYFNMDDLDKEKVYKQVEKLHWKITTKDVQSKWEEIENLRYTLSTGDSFNIESKGNLDHIIDRPHKARPIRNNIVLNIANISNEFKLIRDKVPDTILKNGMQKHPWVLHWKYYELDIDGIKYFLNIFTHNKTGNMGLYTISDGIAP